MRFNHLFSLCLVLVFSSVVQAQEAKLEFENIKNVDINNSFGSVKVRGSEAITKAEVKIKEVRKPPGCDLVVTGEGGLLGVEQRAAAAQARNCETNIEILLPMKEDIDLVLQNNQGDVTIEDFAGSLDIETPNGNTLFKNVHAKEIRFISATRGNFTFDGSQMGMGTIKVNSGNISLSMKSFHFQGSMAATAESGNISIAMPANSESKTTLTSQGATSINTSKGGFFMLELSYPKGELTVKKNR